MERIGGHPVAGFDSVEILSIQLVDKDNILCPNSDRKLRLGITGAEILAVDNADVLAHDTSHKSLEFSTYQGRMVVYIRRTSANGKVTVTATDCSSAAALKGTATF